MTVQKVMCSIECPGHNNLTCKFQCEIYGSRKGNKGYNKAITSFSVVYGKDISILQGDKNLTRKLCFQVSLSHSQN